MEIPQITAVGFDVKEILDTQNWNLTRDSLNTLRAFLNSADDEILINHFEDATIPARSSKAARYNKYVLQCARRLWDAQDALEGICKVEHDFYLKKFFLTSTDFVSRRFDYLLVDEFQDTTPALLEFIKNCRYYGDRRCKKGTQRRQLTRIQLSLVR